MVTLQRLAALVARGPQRGGRRAPHVVIEIKNPANARVAHEISQEAEVVCPEVVGRRLVIHAASRPNLTGLFQELLDTTQDSFEIYYDPVPGREATSIGPAEIDQA